jgi:alkyldihydroxyacetonephosphate synthase
VQAEGFTLGHSPQSLHLSSVGGWLATRATGQFSSLYGGIENLVIGMKVVLANGSEVKVQALPRSAFGPDLRALFIGAEGTLGIITEVTLKLFRAADTRTYQAFSLSSVANGLKALRRIMQTGLQPLLLRLYDENESRRIAGEDFDGCLLLTADSGKDGDALAEHVMVHDLVTNSGGTTLGPGLAEAWMSQRFDYSAIGSLIGSDGMYAETIEVAHSWSKIGDLYEALKKELAPLTDSVQAHFSHAYPQGSSLYMIVTGEASSNEDAARRLEEIWDAAMQCTLRLGGVLSHHHGAGIARAKYSKQALGSSFEVLQSVKAALDPKGILNPGKLGLGTLNGPAERPYDVRTDRPGR